VGRMRVDSGAVQWHVLMRARVGVRVGSHPRPAIHMRKKEASRCKVCAPANGCMLVSVHWVQCVPSSYVRTVVVRTTEPRGQNKFNMAKLKLRQLVGLLGLRTVVRGWGSYEPCYH
jgi:hypothetical protein